jgi:hypothetical protein
MVKTPDAGVASLSAGVVHYNMEAYGESQQLKRFPDEANK